MIYMDYNGTTPLLDEVRAAMEPYWGPEFGNPSSGTSLGRRAREAVEGAREQVAALIGALPAEIIFTSGGTESNNSVVFGLGEAFQGGGNHIVTTAVEHPSILEPCVEWLQRGGDVTFVQVDASGRVSPDTVLEAIRPDTFLVTVMHANNETGTIMPLREIGKACRERGVLFHTDAAQSLGKVPVDVDDLMVDLLTVAGHKLYAPKGIGALYVRKGVQTPRYLFGAGQEQGRRAGTENVAYDVALGKACTLAGRDLEYLGPRLKGLRDRLEAGLFERVPGFRVFGHPQYRLPNTLFGSFPGVSGSEVLSLAENLYASTGAACHSDQVKLSHVLAAMGVTPEAGKGAVRLTLGRRTTEEDADSAAETLAGAFRKAVDRRSAEDR